MMFFSRWHRVAPMVLVGAFALCADGAVAQEQDDDAEAVRLYRQAAEQGNADAQFNLGVMYLDGDGVPQDDAEAMRWFRQAGSPSRATPKRRPTSGTCTTKAVGFRRTTPKPCGGSAKPPSKATPKHSSTSGSAMPMPGARILCSRSRGSTSPTQTGMKEPVRRGTL